MPVAASANIDLGVVAATGIGLAAIALFTAFAWNLMSAVTAQALSNERNGLQIDEGHADADVPRTRLGTLTSLIDIVGRAVLVSPGFLSDLISVSVNVWSIITGMSILGLAIGFGSQTLVKDIASGLFFLIDEAFHYGEYIETSGAKGTVEKISIRSVSCVIPAARWRRCPTD